MYGAQMTWLVYRHQPPARINPAGHTPSDLASPEAATIVDIRMRSSSGGGHFHLG
jgi:hypothetical protein